MRQPTNILILVCGLSLGGHSIGPAQTVDPDETSKSTGPIQVRIQANSDDEPQSGPIQIRIRRQKRTDGSEEKGTPDQKTSVTTSGKIVIVGSDGKRREITIGSSGGQAGSIPSQISQALKKAGINIQLDGLSGGPHAGQQRVIVVDPSGASGPASRSPGSATTVIEKIIQRPSIPDGPAIGVELELPTRALRAQLGLKPDQGMVVRRVLQDMPAATAGLQAFDVILQANQKPVSGVEQLQQAIQQAGDQGSVTLKILRRGQPLSLKVRPAVATAAAGKKRDKASNRRLQKVDVNVIRIETDDLLDGQQLEKLVPELKQILGSSNTIHLQAHQLGTGQQRVIVVPNGKGPGRPGLEQQVQQLQKQVEQLQEQLRQLQIGAKPGT